MPSLPNGPNSWSPITVRLNVNSDLPAGDVGVKTSDTSAPDTEPLMVPLDEDEVYRPVTDDPSCWRVKLIAHEA
jgi:hypothetical protein